MSLFVRRPLTRPIGNLAAAFANALMPFCHLKRCIPQRGRLLAHLSTYALILLTAPSAFATPDEWPRAHLNGQCSRAVREAASAADNNDANALLQISDWHFFGTCLLKDDFASARYAERAAEAGSVRAMVVLGQVYAQGTGVTANPEIAEKWLRKAIESKDSEAAFMLAQLYYALNRPELLPQALSLTEQAAAANRPEAFALLGVVYGSGLGVAPDYAKSRSWLDRAIAAGKNDAAVMVALSWACLHLRDYECTEQAVDAVPNTSSEYRAAQINRAHMLLLNGQISNAREIYETNRALRGPDEFNKTIRADFATLRAADITHPAMQRIEAAFGIANADPPPQAPAH